MALTPQYVVKDDPELSANQLAEYLTASFVRQESILRAAKYRSPETSPPRIRYKDSRRSIARCLASNRLDLTIIQETIAYLQGIARDSTARDFARSDARLSAEALQAFMRSLNQFGFAGFTFTLGEARPPRLDMEGVAISVRPDVVITAVGRDQSRQVGGLLAYFSKEIEGQEREGARRELGLTSATLIHEYARQHLASRGEATRRLCLSLDVFGRSIQEAPAASTRRLANMQAACRGIVSAWPRITPPDNWPN